MKRNLLTAVAMLVSAFFLGTTIAEAADVQFSGQMRPRFEMNEQADFNEETSADFFVQQRTRLNAKVNVNSDTGVFIQLQDTRTYGEDNAGTTASDGDTDVGLHQAYFTLKNFAGMPFDAKIGRQQIVLDGHRIFGHTGWAVGGNTHDAVRFTHSKANHTLSVGASQLVETGNASATKSQISDSYTGFVWSNFKGVLGGGLSLYYVYLEDNASSSTIVQDSNVLHTVGFRQAGKLAGIDYRGEYYYQGGKSPKTYAGSGLAPTGGRAPNGSHDAYMFGMRVGKAFPNLMWKPKVTLWYDELSGTDDGDADRGDWSSWNTLFDTGHKFYGLMDLMPANAQSLGLRDYSVKLAMKPAAGYVFKIDWHLFETQKDPGSNPTVATADGIVASDANDGDLGHELDLTLVNKYNANTKVVIGYSSFWSESTFQDQGGYPNNHAHWAYVMFDVKF